MFPDLFAPKFIRNIERSHTPFLTPVITLHKVCLSLAFLQGFYPSNATVAGPSSVQRKGIQVYFMVETHERHYWASRIRLFHESQLYQRHICRDVKLGHKEVMSSLYSARRASHLMNI
jgi:hypothetical protein